MRSGPVARNFSGSRFLDGRKSRFHDIPCDDKGTRRVSQARRPALDLQITRIMAFLIDTVRRVVRASHESQITIHKSLLFGGSVWESNPPFWPRRTESMALKATRVTGPLSPPMRDHAARARRAIIPKLSRLREAQVQLLKFRVSKFRISDFPVSCRSARLR